MVAGSKRKSKTKSKVSLDMKGSKGDSLDRSSSPAKKKKKETKRKRAPERRDEDEEDGETKELSKVGGTPSKKQRGKLDAEKDDGEDDDMQTSSEPSGKEAKDDRKEEHKSKKTKKKKRKRSSSFSEDGRDGNRKSPKQEEKETGNDDEDLDNEQQRSFTPGKDILLSTDDEGANDTRSDAKKLRRNTNDMQPMADTDDDDNTSKSPADTHDLQGADADNLEATNPLSRDNESDNEDEEDDEEADDANDAHSAGEEEKDQEEEKKEDLDSKSDSDDKDTTESKDKQDETEDDGSSILTNASFASLGVEEPLCKAAEAVKWKTATRIQKEAIPPALQGRDVIGLAETGSGKTGAFALPILQNLLKTPSHHRSQAVFACVLAPTRELAFQIHDVFTALGSIIGANAVCIVGGVDMASQAIALARNPHVVVATPGRLLDHLTNTKGFHLRKLKYLIMDEADRMLGLDFEKELNEILAVIPDSITGGRRTMLFSATMTSKVQKLQRASLTDPVRVEVSTKFQTPKKLIQNYMFIPAKYKDVYLTYLINEFAGQSVLVFGATCNNVQRLALMLRNLGFPAVCLHGQMTQPKRLGALNKFKSGGRDVLICTDVASRGLDLPHVDVVINFDLPGHGKDYIHRVGRTARAGRSGRALAMVTQYDVEVYQRIEALLGKKLPEYKLNEEVVLLLHERVNEAQRLATRELKEQLAAASGRNRRGRGASGDAADGDEGVESIVKNELKRGYHGRVPNQRGAPNKRSGRGRRTPRK